MTFRQFALRNVTRNKRTYAAYFFSSAFSVMIFFVFAMFVFHPGLQKGEIGSTAAYTMSIAEYIIYVFSIFFVFYSMSAFLQSRKKEFGILMMHGMSQGQLKRLVFLENMIIGFSSTACGIVVGMIFSKLFLLVAAYVLDTEALPFYLSWKAVLLASAAFTVLFLIISAFTAVFVRGSKLVELLKGRAKPKSEPKASILLSLLSAALILAGYVLSFTAQAVQVIIVMLPVIVIVIIGTYFLFTQLSVYIIRMLKRNRFFYWKKTNLLTLSDLAFRMKDNARMFFLVSIVSTVAFCAIGTLAGFRDMLVQAQHESTPFAFTYSSAAGNPQENAHLTAIEQALAAEGMTYKKLKASLIHQTDAKSGSKIALVQATDYNGLAAALGYPEVELQPQTALFMPNMKMMGEAAKQIEQTMTLKESGLSLNIVGIVEKPVLHTLTFGRKVLIVPDETYRAVHNPAKQELYYGYQVDKVEATAAIGKQLADQIGSPDQRTYEFGSLGYSLKMVKMTFGAVLFVGLFVGSIFFVAAGSFLYFRLYTDLESDTRHYRMITKIGLTEQELKTSITTQLALLFFVPTIVAIVHSSVAFVALHNLFQYSVLRSSTLVLGSFFAVQLVYFLFVRSRYLQQIKRAVM